jgi:chromate reductase
MSDTTQDHRTFNVLAVVGSLQARSSNKALVEVFSAKLGSGVTITQTRALHVLPPFNSDFESEDVPAPVTAWRAELAAADAVVFATPEYAFGIAGALKNSLDWVVGSGELVAKPVAIMGASTMATGASLALEALERTLRVMSAEVVGVLSVPHVRAKLDADGRVTDDATNANLDDLAEKLLRRLTQ